LPKHGVVVDVDFDEWSELAIDIRKIAVGAVIGTAVRDRDKFVTRSTVNIQAPLVLWGLMK
jgi:hypothetical protein